MTLNAILFDLDDTLHDKSATLNRVGRLQYEDAGLAALGVNLEAWLACYVDLNNQRIEKTQVFSKLMTNFNLPPVLEAKLLKDFAGNLGQLAVPFPGAHDIVSWCKINGLKVGSLPTVETPSSAARSMEWD